MAPGHWEGTERRGSPDHSALSASCGPAGAASILVIAWVPNKVMQQACRQIGANCTHGSSVSEAFRSKFLDPLVLYGLNRIWDHEDHRQSQRQAQPRIYARSAGSPLREKRHFTALSAYCVLQIHYIGCRIKATRGYRAMDYRGGLRGMGSRHFSFSLVHRPTRTTFVCKTTLM